MAVVISQFVFKFSPVDHELELADNAEVVDCDYNAEVEYSACLISMFCYRTSCPG